MEYCIQSWGLQHKKDAEILVWVQRMAMQIIRKLEHIYEERAKENTVTQSGVKKEITGDLLAACQ